METIRDYDILEMPVQGLAAYWLSIKKLLDAKKSKACMQEEAAHTDEPYIKYLLEIGLCTSLPDATVSRLAETKRDVLLDDYQHKIDLMRVALHAIASGENPRVTLVRMNAKFSLPPLDEKQTFEMAHGVLAGLGDPDSDKRTLLNVDHRMRLDQIMVKLLFYAVFARRESIQALDKLLPYVTSPYFAEGLSLAVDGFEPGFLAHHLACIRDETMINTRRKMDMSLDICLGIRNKLPYEQVHLLARAYML